MGDVVALIPARAGSKGVPDKNIKILAGKPILAYSVVAARLTDSIDRIIVSTDSDRYANIAREYGAEVPFLRPAGISGDRSTDYECIKHMLDWMRDKEGYCPKYLAYLRPTTPLRETSHIEKAIKRLRQTNNATAVRSVHEMSESSYKTFEIEKNYLKCVGSGSMDIENANRPRQEFKKTYQANGYVDIIKASYVIENGKIHGNQVLAYVTPHVVEVDTVEEFAYLEYLIFKKPMLVDRLFR
ncbi:cytidylyltransferase domain-containing protein [Candidatus Omnitrophota bacterium]